MKPGFEPKFNAMLTVEDMNLVLNAVRAYAKQVNDDKYVDLQLRLGETLEQWSCVRSRLLGGDCHK